MARIYVYCPRPSTSAFDLLKALGASRLRRFDGMDFFNKGKRLNIEPGSTIICWGVAIPELDGVRVINSLDRTLNKYEESQKLHKAGVPTVATVLVNRDQRLLGYDPTQLRKMGYMPRSFQHQGGTDLLFGGQRQDFWVLKEQFTHEYRIHSFSERSIRAGVKIPREGFTPVAESEWKANSNLVHPWIRSFDAGWRINYDDFKSTKDMRAIAHLAVKTLGLTFGAVDIAMCKDGTYKVLEVNSAPGSDPNTTAAYVKAIQSLLEQPAKAAPPPEGLPEPRVIVQQPPAEDINALRAKIDEAKRKLAGRAEEIVKPKFRTFDEPIFKYVVNPKPPIQKVVADVPYKQYKNWNEMMNDFGKANQGQVAAPPVAAPAYNAIKEAFIDEPADPDLYDDDLDDDEGEA